MAAGDNHVEDPVDTVHHKMESAVHSHHVYKSVWSPVILRRTTHSREGACQPIAKMNLWYVAVTKDSQIVGHTPPGIYSQLIWQYITRRGSVIHCPASVILLGEGGKEKALKYHVNSIEVNYC